MIDQVKTNVIYGTNLRIGFDNSPILIRLRKLYNKENNNTKVRIVG